MSNSTGDFFFVLIYWS